jgi:hypothetical protein
LQTGAGAVLNVMQPAAGLMAARIAGCVPIIAVDRLPSRLARGRSHRGELHYDSSRTQVGIGFKRSPLAQIRRIGERLPYFFRRVTQFLNENERPV